MAPARKKSKTAVGAPAGHDSTGRQFASREDLWAAEAGDDAAREAWYAKGLEYWEKLPASVDTVLGGYASVSPRDCEQSDAFLRASVPALCAVPRPRLRAAELGAGVGRVTKGLLLRHFAAIDVVEPVKHYLAAAEADIGTAPAEGQAVRFVCEPLQTWSPEKATFDVIWVQWCVGHLTDDDFVLFMGRCAAGLSPGGLIALKENNCAEGFVVDKEDSSLTRSHEHFLTLFARCKGLRLERVVKQTGFPAELYAVRMYALRHA